MKITVQGLKLDGQNWIFSYRHGGRARRMTIGKFPAVTAKDASKGASILAGQICCGRDPAGEKRAAGQAARTASAPVRDLIEPVLKRYLRHAKARTRPSTFAETSRVFRIEVLPKWKGRRLSEISRADVRQLIAAIAARPAPVSANRCLASLKTFLAFAIEFDLISVSPAAAIKAPAVEKARERTLDDSELSAVLQACDGLGEYGAIVQLLILTGQRRSEVANLSWSEIDLAAKTWTLPAVRAKNGRQHVIPLSDAAIAILGNLLPPPSLGPVFSPVGFSQSKAKLDAALAKAMGQNCPAWCVHDLRRTATSGMAGLGTAPHVIEACLNHQSGIIRGVAAVYNRCRYEPEKRAALDLWGAHVAALPVRPVALAAAA